METEILPFSDKNAEKAALILKNGGIVGIPTETVYGLAANALDEKAVKAIFTAKGRPQDNPLIVHISSLDMLPPLIKGEIPDISKKLAETFWGGPLTMIFRKSGRVPSVTSGRLDTVAVRFPKHKAACAIIEKCGFPLAAPSANISGRPSPTSAGHVYHDMNGKIPLIIDGGSCEVGVESTVVCFEKEKIRILRPGGITPEMLSEFGEVEIDKAVCGKLLEGEKAASPGMKYKHYSPKANVIAVNAHGKEFEDYCESHIMGKTWAFKIGGNEKGIFLNFGDEPKEQSRRLFALLRLADENGIETVYVEMPERSGIGLAVYNRLLRAAGFEIVNL